jgi:ferric-dicitrate binding protein FerR (iron transport regulator)
MTKNEQPETILLITRYLAGNATPAEVADLVRWVEESDLNKQYFDEARNIWESSSSLTYHGTIKMDDALSKVLDRISFDSKIKTIWIYWKKLAAVILIPLLLGNLIWYYLKSDKISFGSQPVYNEVYAAFGTRTALKLADGSSVWLNSGSSLKYPARFTGRERIVQLTGEAYFEVEKNPEVPFLVKTPTLNVKATGTKFNVSDYITDINSDVALVSGKVFVTKINDDNRKENIQELFPSQHLILSKKTGTISVQNEDIIEYISWKDGKLVFRNKPLSYVVNKISQVFNVDIELQGNTLQDYRYRATFEDESLTEILKLLKVSSPIDYVEVKRNPLPDGSYQKKKVIIFSRVDSGY